MKFRRKLDEMIAEYKEEEGDEKMNFVLDATAVLSYLGDKVEELLEKAERGEVKLFMNYVNLGEVYYMISKELGMARQTGR